jgi:hypothetical protein
VPDVGDRLEWTDGDMSFGILAPGVPTALTHADQRVHLPDELRNEAVVVRSGAELVALIESS